MRRSAAILLAAVVMPAGLAHAALTCFAPVVQPGALTFTVSQGGAPLTGNFTDFDADICLDLESSQARGHIAARVRTASVDTMLPELDQALRGPEFLDSQQWPEATFESESVERVATDRFAVTGSLTIRDIARPIEVMFQWQAPAGDDAPRLTGTTTIKRLDYDVGLGEWRDTRWVADNVTLEFSVALTER